MYLLSCVFVVVRVTALLLVAERVVGAVRACVLVVLLRPLVICERLTSELLLEVAARVLTARLVTADLPVYMLLAVAGRLYKFDPRFA